MLYYMLIELCGSLASKDKLILTQWRKWKRFLLRLLSEPSKFSRMNKSRNSSRVLL